MSGTRWVLTGAALVAALIAALVLNGQSPEEEAAPPAPSDDPAAPREVRPPPTPDSAHDPARAPKPGTAGEESPAPAGPATVRVRGSVLDPDGKPLKRVRVYVTPKDPARRRSNPDVLHLYTGESGEWSLDVPDLANCWLCAMPESKAGLLTGFVDGAEIAAGKPVAFRLLKAPVRTIEVTDLEGRSLEGVRISIVPDTERPGVTWPGPEDSTHGLWVQGLPPHGRLDLAFPWDGPLNVSASKDGHGAAAGVLEAGGSHLHLRLGPSATIRIRVEGVDDPSISVSAGWRRENYRGITEQNMDVERVIEFRTYLGPGKYSIYLQARGYENCVLDDVLVSEFGETVERVAKMVPKSGMGQLQFGIIDEEALRPPVLVALYRPADSRDGEWKRQFLSVSGKNPTFSVSGKNFTSFPHLPIGLYDVAVFHIDGYRATYLSRAAVREGEPAVIDLEFGSTISARMPAVDLGGTGVSGAFICSPKHPPLPLYLARRGLVLLDAAKLPAPGEPIGPLLARDSFLRLKLRDGTVREVPIPVD